MKKGKKICEQLKQIRLDIARKNGIEYTPNECHHEGDCAGTCPACENELLYLEREISRKRSLGKAAIVGISMGMVSLSLSSCMGSLPEHTEENTDGYIGVVDTMSELEGNISKPYDMDRFIDSVPVIITSPQETEKTDND